MTHHILKIKKQFMEAKILRKKPFEVRYNDRNFHVGDTITYTTDRLPSMEYEGVYEITYVTAFEQKKGWVVFGDCKMIKVVQQSNTPPTVPAEAEGEARERGLVCLFCGKGFGYAGEKPDEATLKAACDHEAECPDNPYKKKIAELTEALKAASPPPSREAREAAAVVLRIEISRILGIVLGDLTYWHEKAEWLNEFADWLEAGINDEEGK